MSSRFPQDSIIDLLGHTYLIAGQVAEAVCLSATGEFDRLRDYLLDQRTVEYRLI